MKILYAFMFDGLKTAGTKFDLIGGLNLTSLLDDLQILKPKSFIQSPGGGGGDTSIVRGQRSSELGSNLEQNL